MMKNVVRKAVCAATVSALTVGTMVGMAPARKVYAATKTITFWHGWSGAELDVLKDSIEKFEKANKNIKVKAVAVPFTQLQNKLRVALMSSAPSADVFLGPVDWEGVFATMKGGVLTDLSKTSLKSELKNMKASAVKAGKYKGKQVGFPESVEAPVLIYNKDIVKTPPKTYEEMMKIAKAFTKDGNYGVATDKGNYYYQRAWLSAFGGTEFTNEDKATTGYNGKSFVNFLKFMKDFNASGVIPKNSDYNTIMALFTSGKAAFMINGPWSFGDIEKSKMKGKWGIANYPTVNGKVAHPFMGAKMFYVPKSSKSVDEAAKFIKFMTSPATQKAFNSKAGHIPANKTVKVDDWKSAAVMDQVEVAEPTPNIPEMGEIWTPVGDAMNKVMGGTDTPEKAAKEANEKITKAIKKLRGE